MKKIIAAILLIVFTVMSMQSGIFVAFAESEQEQSYVVLDDNVKTVINSWEYHDAISTIKKEGEHLSFQLGHWTEYNVYANKAGYFNIFVVYGCMSEKSMEIKLNGKSVQTLTLPNTNGYFTGTELFVVTAFLEEGINTLRVTNKKDALYFDAVAFEPIFDIEISELKADNGKNILSDLSNVPRGTDSFTVSFNQKYDKSTLTEDSVILKSGDEKIPFLIEADGEVIILKLLKTLEYGKDYSLTFNGIGDTYGLSAIGDYVVEFKTKDSDSGGERATFNVIEAKIVGDIVNISAEMISKADVKIEGRGVWVYIIDPDGKFNMNPIYEGKSGENGVCNIKAKLPENSKSGLYGIILAYEYAEEDMLIELPYLTPEVEAEYIEELKGASSVEEVEAFFEKNQIMLGISLQDDLKGLDESEVYAYFVTDKPLDAVSLFDSYYTAIAMEKINQAESADEIEGVLFDENLSPYIAIDKEKLALLENEKEALLTAILNLNPIKDKISFKETIEKFVDEAYAKEFEKADVSQMVENKSIYVGQIAEIKLNLVESVDDVKKVILKLAADGEDAFKKCSFKADDSFEVTLEENGNEAEITLTAIEPVSDLDAFGTLTLANNYTKDTYEVSICGEVIYDVGTGIDVVTDVLAKTVEITVSENTSKNEGTTSSRPSSSRPSSSKGSGGGSSYKPIISTPSPSEAPTEVPTEVPTETPDEYSFTDIENVSWAKESVYGLLGMGVLSKSEDNKFNPDKNVTRAEFVKMVVLSFDFFEDGLKADFSDVDEGKWYYSVAAAAKKHGIITGDEKNNFNGEAAITRQDMASIVKRAFEKKGYSFSEGESALFTDDGEIASYAKDAVYKMQKEGIINGMGDNSFAPLKTATRAQAAKVIYMAVKAVNGK